MTLKSAPSVVACVIVNMASGSNDEDALEEVLREIGLQEYIQAFKDNLISLNQVHQLSESDFERLGVVAIGNRIKIKCAVEAYIKGAQTSSPAINKFLELKQVRGKKKVATLKSNHMVKTTRRVRVGWKHNIGDNKYKVMSLKEGGGQQMVDLEKSLSLEEASQKIVQIYFPNGQSYKFKLSEVEYYIASFTNEIVDLTGNVGDYFEKVTSNPVRWYLHTKLKVKDCSSSEDELPELPSMLTTASVETQYVEVPQSSSTCSESRPTANTDTNIAHVVGENQTSHTETDDTATGTPTVTFKRRRPQFVRRPRPRPQTESEVYSSYVHLVSEAIVISNSSDEDTEERHSPAESSTNPKASSSSTENVRLYEILQQLSRKANSSGPPSKFNVTRRSPLEGARRAIHRTHFDPLNNVSVKFADDFGQSEGAVDCGGPKRELFRLVLREIKNTAAFVGEENDKMLSLNTEALRDGLYRDIGILMAMAIVHGGQWPGYLHPVAYKSFACNTSTIDVSIDDVIDCEQRHMILKLKQANTVSDLEEVMDANYTLFNVSGCYRAIRSFSEKTRDQLVKDMLQFLVVGRNLPAISQFLEGLEACGIKKAVLEYPHQFQEIFCKNTQGLTAEMIETVFSIIHYSEAGSNRRLQEETAISYWCDLLMDVGDGKTMINLKELLAFATGSDQIPYLGFGVDPSIEFVDGAYPQANTCAMVLKLPLHKDFNTFKNCMEFAIQNCQGFGMA